MKKNKTKKRWSFFCFQSHFFFSFKDKVIFLPQLSCGRAKASRRPETKAKYPMSLSQNHSAKILAIFVFFCFGFFGAMDRWVLLLVVVGVCSATSLPEDGMEWGNYTDEVNPSFSQTFAVMSYEAIDVLRTQLGDFNGDGAEDVFIYNGAFGGAAEKADIWLANVGSGSPPKIKSYTLVNGPTLPALSGVVSAAQVTIQTVKLVDWNNDGCMDIYVFNTDGGSDQVYLFNKASSSFDKIKGPKPGLPFSTNPSIALIDLSRYQFADFNGDGFQDLFFVPGQYGDQNPPQDIVFLNKNTTSYEQHYTGFSTPLSLTSSLACFELQRIRFADFNNDNCADMYIINQGDGPDSLSLGSKTGQFTTIQGPETPISSILNQAQIDLSRVQFGDFNADGYNDVYFISGNGDAGIDTIWFFNGGVFQWSKTVGLNRKLFIGSYSTTALSDLNSIKFLNMNPTRSKATDIYQMIVMGNDNIYYSLLTGQFYEAKGKGAYTPIESQASGRSIDVTRANFGDLNGDGFVDIYWANGEPEVTQKDVLKLAPGFNKP